MNFTLYFSKVDGYSIKKATSDETLKLSFGNDVVLSKAKLKEFNKVKTI